MNPAKLKRWFIAMQPISLLVFVVFAVAGLAYALYFSPPDYLHGELVRILYVHVPAAWLAVGLYGVMGICSFASLVLRSPFYSLCAQSLALPGCVLTVICMATGALWGKPAWGTWWVWDARLTSVVILFFFWGGGVISKRERTLATPAGCRQDAGLHDAEMHLVHRRPGSFRV